MEKKRTRGREGEADSARARGEAGGDSCVCQQLGGLLADVAAFLEGREEERLEGRARELAGRVRQAQSNIGTGKGTSPLRPAKIKMTPPKLPPSQDRPARAAQGKSSRDQMNEAKSICSSSSAEEPNYLSDEELQSPQNVVPNSKSKEKPTKQTEISTLVESANAGLLPRAVKSWQIYSSFECSSDENDSGADDMKKFGIQAPDKSRSRPPPPPFLPPKSKSSSQNNPKTTMSKNPPPPPSAKSHKPTENQFVEGKANKRSPQHGDKSVDKESSAEEEAHYEQSDDESDISMVSEVDKGKKTFTPSTKPPNSASKFPPSKPPKKQTKKENVMVKSSPTSSIKTRPNHSKTPNSRRKEEEKGEKSLGVAAPIPRASKNHHKTTSGQPVSISSRAAEGPRDNVPTINVEATPEEKATCEDHYDTMYSEEIPEEEEIQEEDEIYESLMNQEMKKRKVEGRTEVILSVPGVGVISSAKILNASADHLGWLWRKEGFLRSDKKCWALIYQNVLFVYKDPQDQEPQEQIKLDRITLKKIKNTGFTLTFQEAGKERKLEFKAQGPEKCTEWVENIEKASLKKPSKASKDHSDSIQIPQNAPLAIEEEDGSELNEDSTYDDMDEEEPNNLRPSHNTLQERSATNQEKPGKKKFVQLSPRSSTQQKPAPPPMPPAPPAAHKQKIAPNRPNLKGPPTLAPSPVIRSKSFGQSDYSQLPITERKSSSGGQMDFGSELAVKLKKRSVH